MSDNYSAAPPASLPRQRLASNTSENFWLSAELLRDLGLDPRTFLVVHKPYAEHRAVAAARLQWPAKQVAVTSQQISFEDYRSREIPVARIMSMLAGEALRLESYAAADLIELDEPVPADLLKPHTLCKPPDSTAGPSETQAGGRRGCEDRLELNTSSVVPHTGAG